MSQPKTPPAAEEIPFSWVEKPGAFKVTVAENFEGESKFVPKLRPPPGKAKAANSCVHDHHIQIPPPPCPFQPPHYKTFPKKGGLIWKRDYDPFLAAHKKCTRSTKIPAARKEKGLWNIMSFLRRMGKKKGKGNPIMPQERDAPTPSSSTRGSIDEERVGLGEFDTVDEHIHRMLELPIPISLAR